MSVRLERFELRAFGPFTATTLELQGARSGDLHIICGPNEVGKSTAQRGIGDFLFGIPPRSTDNQVHEYVDLRLAAVLVDEHSRQHELVRRKGTRQTLLDANGEPVDEARCWLWSTAWIRRFNRREIRCRFWSCARVPLRN